MCKGRCYAYADLAEQLKKHCSTYRLLHEKQELGRGRYNFDKGESAPNDDVSDFLRGGIISSLAVFEEFLGNIFSEAFERICYRHECKCNCPCSPANDASSVPSVCKCKCKPGDLKSPEDQESKLFQSVLHKAVIKIGTGTMAKLLAKDNPMKEVLTLYKRMILEEGISPTLHDLDDIFKHLHVNSNKKNPVLPSQYIVSDSSPIVYLFLLDDTTHSKIEIKDKQTLCAIMSLFYGYRCVSAHGVPDKTFKTGALKSFLGCEKCGGEVTILSTCREFCEKTDSLGFTVDSKDDKRKVFIKVKRYPNDPKFITYCKDLSQQDKNKQHANNALELIREHWETQAPGTKEYPSEFGFYQLYRIYTYIKVYKRTQYMTYRLFVRINQFLLLVAFRIKLAVAKWLTKMEDSEDLKNLWGYKKDRTHLKNLFMNEEEKHRIAIEEIKNLSKPPTPQVYGTCFF